MRFLSALQFLTTLPVPQRYQIYPEKMGHTLVYFPVVGLLIGLILAGIYWLFSLVLPSAVVNVLLIVSLTVITGALHLDGFIDTCDGLAGAKSVEARWAAMHDSRAGGIGVIGVCLLILVKYITLNSIPDSLLIMTLIIMPVISRWVMVYAIFAYPYAQCSNLGKLFKQGVGWQGLLVASLLTLAIVASIAKLAGIALMLGAWIITVLAATYFRRKFAGLTGDTYGAINELAEVFVLILISLLAYNQWLVSM